MPDLPKRYRLAYVGNFLRTYSTEQHVKTAFEANGHTVVPFQEGDMPTHEKLVSQVADFDFVLWTRTGEYAERIGPYEQWRLITTARRLGVPVIAYHLDRWWGLARQKQLLEEPYFRGCDIVITPDGCHDDMWERVGIDHVWMNPAVTGPETGRGTPQDKWATDLVFVGTWQSYHNEWKHRTQLVHEMKRSFGNRIRFRPDDGVPIRGKDLQNLYASVKVVVGDSCLAPGFGGRPMTHYTSDRVPETLGRGGFLIHPAVPGVTDGTHYKDGEHLVTWNPGEWGTLKGLINRLISSPDMRARISEAGMKHVIENHTYEVRARQIIDLLETRGMLSS